MVFVISSTGKKLMPTSEYRARKLLKNNKAKICKYTPFTIQLLLKEDGETQPIEYCCDTGYQHIGISIKSEKKEYVNEQRDLLRDEVEKYNDCRKYRRTRRNRLRYRKARWNNRRNNQMCKDGFTPSIRNKRDIHINLFKMYYEICPITKVIFEMGQFDTQLLKAIEEGKPLPEGIDYQQGEGYGYTTLREAVFSRDNYTCKVCKKNAFKHNKILRIHHIGYLNNDRTNRMSNLFTVCTDCHTPKNHQPGGKLYDLKPKLSNFKGATFMTMVRWDILDKLKKIDDNLDIELTYGALTKLKRKTLNLKKSHNNDAYSMGEYHPVYREDFKHYQKLRRNNRILSKFYDAKYTDIRDGSIKSGKQLSCNRTNRKEQRNSDKNERIYRGHKVSKGKTVVRNQHYQYRPNDIVWFEGKKYYIKGCFDYGKRVRLDNNKSIYTNSITKHLFVNGWNILLP